MLDVSTLLRRRQSRDHRRSMPPGPIAIRFEHVDFIYPPRSDEQLETVLHNIDLEIPAKTRVAIVGETGSGKTTFAKLLTRLMDPSRGRVLANGVPRDEVRFDNLRKRILMVPQDGFLFDATIFSNVARGPARHRRRGRAVGVPRPRLADC